MSGLDPKALEAIMKIVQDPRYDQGTYMRCLQPAAELKLAITAGGLVPKLNTAYGWKLAENGNWTVEQANDVIFEIVAKPSYSLQGLISAINKGQQL
jgi:hypothetical protein